MSLRRLSSVDKRELIASSIRDYYLWPIAPSGTLKKPSHKYDVDKDSKQNQIDFERSMKHVDAYYHSKSTIMQWYFAALLGILGNIFVSIILVESIRLYNTIISGLLLLVIFVVIRIGREYMPEITLRYTILGDYQQFPKGYGRHVDTSKITSPIMQAHISMNFLDDEISKYGVFIRNCLIKDALTLVLKDVKYIKVKKISRLSPLFPSFDISFSTNLYALLHPNNQEAIAREFMSLNGATLNAKMNSGVFSFELDESEWTKYGVEHLNEISHISSDLEELNNLLVSEILNSTKGAFRRDFTRRLYARINPVRTKIQGKVTSFFDSVGKIKSNIIDKLSGKR